MFGFNKHKKHIVTIIKDGKEIGDGTLRFGNGKGIFIATNFTKDLSQHFNKDKTKNHLKLKTKRKTFTVINCTYEHFTIFADAILKGSTHPSEFLKIFIRYEKISEWFSPNKLNHEKNESETTIKWIGNTNHFQSIINCKSGEYLISSKQGYNILHKTDKAVIKNYTWFCIECTNGQFDFQEMRTKSHHLLTFFRS
ncbi:Uncharacterised protein [Chromobacterium violaceum]|uniref:Uncharacterized protein n=1 Tax=Chromobacterium violaceum TaxID=536 RepID=A0A3S4HSA5_CHRVL|nr:Uncharacterised protein [Chromobacterium violaceum]